MHGVGSRNKLTRSHARHYPGDGLLDVLGRAICTAECLPRKELHEAWEMAHVVRAQFPGGRVIDLCAGYGLAQVMLLIDDSSPEAVAVDARLPPNHGKVHDAVCAAFPRLMGRVRFVQQKLDAIPLTADDVVVSSHACGSLSDDVLERAAAVRARVALLPCCHVWRFREDLRECADPAQAIDLERAATLRAHGYRVELASIPAAVTEKNRLLLGSPER